MGVVKYITYQRQQNVEGSQRFANLCNLTSVNISFISSTKFPGQYKMSDVNRSFPVVCMIMGNRSVFTGEQTCKYHNDINDTDSSDENEDNLEDFEKEEYDNMVRRLLHLPEMGHQVLIVQPYVKWGSAKKRITTPELQLAEAVALVGTLPKWKVVDKVSDISTWG